MSDSEKAGRVSIDQNRIEQARRIQRNSENQDQNRLNTLPPRVSRYEYSGNALDIRPGRYVRGSDEDGEEL